MAFTQEQTEALAAKLDRANIKKNPRGYDYVEGWHAIAEANRIFGFDGWTRHTVRLEETNRDLVELSGNNGPYKQWRVGYLAVVEITAGGVIRQGTGFGTGMAKPEALGEAIEGASKEAETDAMKRALMTFGNPFGLALYDKDKEGVEKAATPPPREPPPVSAAVMAARTAIGMCKDEDALTKWGAANADMIKSMPADEASAVRQHYGKRLMVLRGELQAVA